MADAFLHRRSIFDKHKDAYGFKNPIKQMRVARSWDNPITRRKREKSLNDWASSFAGKRHYRKLSRHNAIHLHEDSMDRVSIEEICDALNRYAIARWLPFKADLLHGADGKHISLHGGHVYLDIGYAPSGELEVYDARAAHPLNVLTHWDSVDEIAGHLLSLAVRQAAKNESVYEKLSFEKGHKDSKGNDAPWVIRSHEDDKVLASFANKDDAVQHLARMKNYSKKESVMKNWSVNVLWRSPAGFECTTRVLVRADSKEAAGREAEEYVRREVGDVDAVAHDIKEYVEGSGSLRETFRSVRQVSLREKLEKMGSPKHEAASRVVADNKFGKVVKARLRDNVLAFLPTDDDGKNDDCTYFFKMDGDDIITKGYHWGRDEIDRSMIADDGYPWTAEPNRPTRDYVHTKAYAKQLVDRVRKCLAVGEALSEKGEAKGDGAAPKTCVLAYKTADDTYYCKNKYGDWTTHIEDAWEGSSPESFSDEMKRNFADVVGALESDLEAVEVEKFESLDLSTPHFKPREHEGEHILYTLYGLDSDGDEMDDIITSPKKSTVIQTAKEFLPDYRRVYNGMQIVAILYDENDKMLDSEVVWSTDQSESKEGN